MDEEVRWIALTKQEAEIILDSLKVSNPQSRSLALKAASLVLELASAEDVRQVREMTGSPVRTGDGA